MSLFASIEELAQSGYVFRITDNGGDSCDRYTVAFSDGDFLTLSGAPTHPQGVSLSGEGLDPARLAEDVEEGRQVDLAVGDLPPHIAQHVLDRVNSWFADFLYYVEGRDASAVAPSRERAQVNDGGYRSFGVGIYSAGQGYCVRLEGRDAAEDRGPYLTAAEAVRATLPEALCLAGDEYQSTVDVSRLTPSPEVAAQVEALEERVRDAWEQQRERQLTVS